MRSASSVRRRATTLERVCICVHPPFGLSFEEEQKESKLICVAATSRPELVFFLAFKTSEGTSKKVSCCDCRCVRDDEESNHEDLDEGDHVHEDRDDHCSASGSVPPYNLFVFGASSLRGLYDVVLVSVVIPFCGRSHVIPTIIFYSVKFFHVGLYLSFFVHARLILLVLEVALHDRSAIMLLRGSRILEIL